MRCSTGTARGRRAARCISMVGSVEWGPGGFGVPVQMLRPTCSLQLHFISLMMSTCQLSERILHTKEPVGAGLQQLIS